MNDLEYLGQLSETVELDSGKTIPVGSMFEHINNRLTEAFDTYFGPNEVDSFDASCNTCKHFERKPMNPVEKAERNIFGMPGRCELKSIEVRGWQRGQFCGFENTYCYENRRTGMRHKEACAP